MSIHWKMSSYRPSKGFARLLTTSRIGCGRSSRLPTLTSPALRILVVDDVADAADSLAVVLELVGCSVRACYDARAALRIAGEFDPQVCLLDLVMPDMGGLELGACLRVAAEGKPLVLIATTALGSDEMKARTKVAGFDAHLTKPIDVSTLIEAIAQLWEKANSTPGASDTSS